MEVSHYRNETKDQFLYHDVSSSTISDDSIENDSLINENNKTLCNRSSNSDFNNLNDLCSDLHDRSEQNTSEDISITSSMNGRSVGKRHNEILSSRKIIYLNKLISELTSIFLRYR